MLPVQAQEQSSTFKVAETAVAAIPGETVRVTLLQGSDLRIRDVQSVFLPGGVWLFRPVLTEVGDQELLEGQFFVSADIPVGLHTLNFQAVDDNGNIYPFSVNLEVRKGFPRAYLKLASRFASEVAVAHTLLPDGRVEALMYFSTRKTPEEVISAYDTLFSERGWDERVSEHHGTFGHYIAKNGGRDLKVRYQRDYRTGVSVVTVALDQ